MLPSTTTPQFSLGGGSSTTKSTLPQKPKVSFSSVSSVSEPKTFTFTTTSDLSHSDGSSIPAVGKATTIPTLAFGDYSSFASGVL